jgi:hypothetical protein
MTGRRWVLGVIVALLVVGLIAFARGPVHHRGQEVGAVGRALHVFVAGHGTA